MFRVLFLYNPSPPYIKMHVLVFDISPNWKLLFFPFPNLVNKLLRCGKGKNMSIMIQISDGNIDIYLAGFLISAIAIRVFAKYNPAIILYLTLIEYSVRILLQNRVKKYILSVSNWLLMLHIKHDLCSK